MKLISSLLCFYFQHLCRPTYCPAGKFYAACKCIDILQNLSGMPVLLKIKVLPRSGPDYPQSDIQIRKLQTSVKRNILSIVDHITVRIVATFQQENSYLVIIEAQSDPGHDTKQTLEPLIQYLDTDKHFEVKVGKLAFSATLTSKIALLEEWNETTAAMAYEARDIEQPIGIFELVYIDDRMKSTMLFTYQPLSRLLYCTQLQLNDTEYFKSSGPIITNASAPLFPIFDYYTITPTQIRVCVDSYLKALNENDKRSGGHLIQELSYELIIPSLALVMMVM